VRHGPSHAAGGLVGYFDAQCAEDAPSCEAPRRDPPLWDRTDRVLDARAAEPTRGCRPGDRPAFCGGDSAGCCTPSIARRSRSPRAAAPVLAPKSPSGRGPRPSERSLSQRVATRRRLASSRMSKTFSRSAASSSRSRSKSTVASVSAPGASATLSALWVEGRARVLAFDRICARCGGRFSPSPSGSSERRPRVLRPLDLAAEPSQARPARRRRWLHVLSEASRTPLPGPFRSSCARSLVKDRVVLPCRHSRADLAEHLVLPEYPLPSDRGPPSARTARNPSLYFLSSGRASHGRVFHAERPALVEPDSQATDTNT
jgi:hypothetical protein